MRVVSVENRQKLCSVSEEFIRRLEIAGREALKLIAERGWALGTIPNEVSVALLDDVMIAEVHDKFMADPTPTDVITFPYGESGEVLISVETAETQRKDYTMDWEGEVTLYLIHGMLHLCGHEDGEDEGRETMNRLQIALLSDVYSPH